MLFALLVVLVLVGLMLAFPRFKSMSHVATSTVANIVDVNISVPIYVVGPQTLVQRLVNIGINESLIRPVNINQLPLLPNGSVVIVYWPSIRPSLIANDPGGVVTVNLTSPIISYLASAITRDDVVGIYANGNVEGIIDFILAYSWAVASNNRLIANGGSVNDYLLAYLIIPVNPHKAVVFVAKWVKPRGLVIGPIYLNQLTTVVANMVKLPLGLKAINGVVDTEDPCYAEYSQYFTSASNPTPGVYAGNGATSIWVTPMLVNTAQDIGIQAYSDGNGTYSEHITGIPAY